MFNIRNLVNRITLPGGTGRDSTSSEEASPARNSGSDHGMTEAEGFLCPTCMIAYSTQEELQSHYEVTHLEPATNYLCPVCKMRCRSSSELENHFASKHSPSKSSDVEELRQELNELNTTLREERWYTEELKKEVDRLQNTLNSQDNGEGGDVFKLHIKGLEENKQLLSSEVILLRKQLAEALEVTTSLKQTNSQLLRSKESEENLAQLVNTSENQKESLERELKSSLQTTQNDDKVDQLEDNLKQALEEINRSQTMLAEWEAKRSAWEAEKDHLIHARVKLEEDLRTIEQSKEKAMAEHEGNSISREQDLQKRQMEIETLRKDREEADAIVVQLRAEVTSLQELLNQSMHQAKGELSDRETELFNCKSQVRALEREMAEYKSRVEELSHSHRSRDIEFQALQVQLTDLQKMNEYQETSLQQCQKKAEAQNSVLEDLKQELDVKTKELKDGECTVTRLNDTITRLEKERSELLLTIEAGEGVNTAIQQLQVENASLQEELTTIRLSHVAETTEWQDKIHALQKGKKELHSMKDKAEESKSQLEKSLSQLKADVEAGKRKWQAAQDSITEKDAVLAKMTREGEIAKSNWEDEKERFVTSEAKLAKVKAAVEDKFAEMKRAHSQLQSELQLSNKIVADGQAQLSNLEMTHTTRVQQLTEKLAQLQDDKAKAEDLLKIQVGEKAADLERAAAELRQTKSQRDALEQQMNSTQADLKKTLGLLAANKDVLLEKEESLNTWEHKFSESQASLQDKTQEVVALSEESNRSSVKLQNLTEELEVVKKQAVEDAELLKEKSSAIRELKGKIELLSSQLEQAEVQLKSANEKLLASQEEVASFQLVKVQLEGELDRLKNASTKQKEDLEKEMLELKENTHILQAEKLSLENHFSQERSSFQLSLEKLERDMSVCDIEKNKLLQRWNNDKDTWEKRKQEWQETQALLQKQKQTLTESVNIFKTDLAQKEKRLIDIQTSLDDTVSANLELEARVSVLDDERKESMQKCADLDHELEKLRTVTVDVRRRLEDSQAALHELCRENQSLQMENAKLQGQKWADDSAAVSCTACYKEFSLTVRKHHCRNCGQIFCNDCSAKNAIVGGSKKPLRVCETCYKELGSR